jgi:hypothetical protein
MKPKKNRNHRGNRGMARASQVAYALRHIETGEYVCLRQSGREYVACFSTGDGAFQFRAELRLTEYVDVAGARLANLPFDYFWLDGEMISRAVVRDDSPRLAG